jgi:hypothetical protein
MTRYNRFVDGVEFISPDSDRTPYTPSQLLAKLGVRDAPKQRRRHAVASWLEDNEPTPLLRRFLADDGLIESAAAGKTPPRSAA